MTGSIGMAYKIAELASSSSRSTRPGAIRRAIRPTVLRANRPPCSILGSARASSSIGSTAATPGALHFKHTESPNQRAFSGRWFGSASISRAPDPSEKAASEGELIPSPLSQSEYDHISEEDMETIYENLSVLCEEYGKDSWEVEYSSGVLTLQLPPHGTYVLNKQPPNQQIWISSPLSGPCRFGYVSNDPSTSSPNYPVNPASTPMTDNVSNTGGGGASGGSDVGGAGEGLRGSWTHFRKPGVTLGTLLEGELRSLGVGSEVGEGWLGVGIK